MSIDADAQPERRLFVELLTRDLTLADAILDLIDNSVNAAIAPIAHTLNSASDYQRVLSDNTVRDRARIDIRMAKDRFEISDDAEGIDLQTAVNEVFKFGRAKKAASAKDRLSVYGIGLKRAIFKIGRQIKMRSDHVGGGFDLDLNVDKWAADPSPSWTIPIDPRNKVGAAKTGTNVVISRLYPDIARRIEDSLFEKELRVRISRTYAYFLNRLVDIYVNDVEVEPTEFTFGKNFSTDNFVEGVLSYSVTAGLAQREGKNYINDNAGWYVFCNGRTVVYADKTALTGWGTPGHMPVFQPKHRPFLGLVFFVSPDPERLPWTTTKASVDQESLAWQDAKRRMSAISRNVVNYLDKRYGDDGVEIDNDAVQAVSGGPVSMLSATIAQKQEFRVVAPRAPAVNTSIQYSVKITEVDRVRAYLGRRSMSNGDVGRHTFNYFMKNEVGN